MAHPRRHGIKPNAGRFYAFTDAKTVSQHLALASLRYVIFGGDKLNLIQLKPWGSLRQSNRAEHVRITETTVHVTLERLIPHSLIRAPCIGKPLRDVQTYVLDPALNPYRLVRPASYSLGQGSTRLFKSSELNAEALSATRLQAMKTSPEATRGCTNRGSSTLLANGRLAYFGRNDTQVKIRGYRIELGE